MRPLMWIAFALLAIACGPTSAVIALPASPSAAPTLTALALSSNVVAVKSSARIIAIRGPLLIVRVDRVNSGAQRAIDDAVIALRTNAETSIQLVTTCTDSRCSDKTVTAMELRGIAVGEPITFMFVPESLSREDGSYLARVIGRF